MFGKCFRHEKVETIPTFSSQKISPHFACKIKTNKSAHAPRGNPPLDCTCWTTSYGF